MIFFLMCCLYFQLHQDLKYDLYGVIERSGLPNYGHYVCVIRSSPSSWHLMNDSLVGFTSHLPFPFMTRMFSPCNSDAFVAG
jgi:ubiquitin C-terminal hydrolase